MRQLLLAGAAMAVYAWRRAKHRNTANGGGGARAEGSNERDALGERASDDDIEPADRWQTNQHGGRGSAGISDLPPADEEAQQASLPPRGSRKGDYHA